MRWSIGLIKISASTHDVSVDGMMTNSYSDIYLKHKELPLLVYLDEGYYSIADIYVYV